MAEHKIRRVAVIRNDVIYGIFTARDLNRIINKYIDSITNDFVNVQNLYQGGFQINP